MPKVIISTVAAEILFTLLAAKISSDHLGMPGLLCLSPILLLFDFFLIRLVRSFCYRPPENHLGVLYRFGRFHRMILPDQWILLLPRIDTIHREISLYMRTAEVQLKKVEMRDGLTVDLWLKVFFKVDLRLVSQMNFLQAVRFEGPEWAEMIKTGMEDIVRNQVFLARTYPELVDQRISRDIKLHMSHAISERMKSFGIIINETHGVLLANIQPNNTYLKAVEASRAAPSLGEAALERLKPILNTLGKMTHTDARTTLLLELASKIVEADELPEIVLSPLENLPQANVRDSKKAIKGDQELYNRRNSRNTQNYPLVE